MVGFSMVAMASKSEENKSVLNSSLFEKATFGTFLKSDETSHPLDVSWKGFMDQFKAHFDVQAIFYTKQVHGDEVVLVDHLKNPLEIIGDGLITSKKKVALLAFHADCQVAFFYDKKKHVIAIIHAGFRGQIKQIYSKAIQKMKTYYNCQAEDLMVSFSASLCKQHSEFKNYKEEFPKALWVYKDASDRFDLKKMAEDELLKNGVLKQNIVLNTECTYEDETKFYSYRKNKTAKRLVSFIFLKT